MTTEDRVQQLRNDLRHAGDMYARLQAENADLRAMVARVGNLAAACADCPNCKPADHKCAPMTGETR